MKKKDYKRPEMTTVRVCQKAQLLAGSRNGSLGDYDDPNDDEWED